MKLNARTGLVVLALSLGLGGSAAGGEATAPRQGKTHHVQIKAMVFNPPTLTVEVGDTVVWTNDGFVPHTATSAPGAQPAFDSGTLAPKATWSLVVTAAGDLPYVCTLHPSMKGLLKIR